MRAVVGIVVVVLAGCTSKEPETASVVVEKTRMVDKVPAEPRVEKIEGLVEQLCACKDDGCGQTIMSEVDKVDLIAKGSAYTKADLKRLELAMQRITECQLVLTPRKPGAPMILRGGSY
jgi:hypothetical protein